MPAFADQINNGPMVLPPLEMSNVQLCRFLPAQPATQEDAEERPVSFALESIRVRNLPERSCLVDGEPIPQTNAEVLRPFDSSDTRGKLRAE